LLAVAEENGIPIFHADSGQVYAGATFGAGLSYYQEGVDTGRVLVAYLAGELDIETLAINLQEGMIIAINLDSAAAQGIEIPEDVMEMADFVIENGESSEGEPALPEMTEEERMADDAAYLEALFCSEERIAEEQAQLDAESE
jgi:putative tryptophan/tyrosine transport system substrate-binding protein